MNILTKHKIVYQSINLSPGVDKEGNFMYKKDYPDRLVKIPTNIPEYADIKLTRCFNKNCNSSIVPTGWRYNLIGIDVDNKDDTINKYNEMCENEGLENTFTIKTMHNGAHEYYRLTEAQKNELGEFTSTTGKLFKSKSMNIDVKYNNQILLFLNVIIKHKLNQCHYFFRFVVLFINIS